MNKKILILVGGISKDSLNQKIFHSLEELAPTEFKIETANIAELPFFSQDLETDLPQKVRDFKDKVESADAILFITPEYNRSFPGVFPHNTSVPSGSRTATR